MCYQPPPPVLYSDIWMNIQEEGHAPSDTLKTEIARSLTAGGLEVPFVYTPARTASAVKKQREEVATEKKVVPASLQRSLSRTTKDRGAAAASADRAASSESEIVKAVSNGDLNVVMEAILAHHEKESMEAIR